jgi:hypothetical protein
MYIKLSEQASTITRFSLVPTVGDSGAVEVIYLALAPKSCAVYRAYEEACDLAIEAGTRDEQR